jgi:outer membrane immunogenic protein
MKKSVLTLTAIAALSGSALAADRPAPVYTKAPVMPAPTSSWTGFYVFGGGGGGLWAANSGELFLAAGNSPRVLSFSEVLRDQKLGGDGWFGTVGFGYDWQFNRSWVVGVFADGQFGNIRGSLNDTRLSLEGTEQLRNSYAAGARLGYLVAPNVLSYVNVGYSRSQWSGATLSDAGLTQNGVPQATLSTTTPSFNRDGWFVGGGVENSLNFFGISAPGWFMKSEYRAAYYGRATLPEAPIFLPVQTLTDTATFKPWVQTVSISLVYRFNSDGSAAAPSAPARAYTKAPATDVGPSWTGFYAFGGGGGGIWDAKSSTTTTQQLPLGLGTINSFLPDRTSGGDGWFGTVGLGYDWQFNRAWVAGVFADGQFGSIGGSLTENLGALEGRETLRTSYAAGARLGYLVAPNVLSYVNAGYSGSQWSGTALSSLTVGNSLASTTPSFNRDGWFIGGGVENSLNFFGISAPGWFMKSEYRAAYYGRATLPAAPIGGPGIGLITTTLTFKPIVQTISTSLVYRFNWGAPLVAKY